MKIRKTKSGLYFQVWLTDEIVITFTDVDISAEIHLSLYYHDYNIVTLFNDEALDFREQWDRL